MLPHALDLGAIPSANPRTEYPFLNDWLSRPTHDDIDGREHFGFATGRRDALRDAPGDETQLEQLFSIEPARCPRGC